MTTTALITGANKGIGYEIARQLGERGITAIVGARDEERGRAAAERLGQPYVRLDVTDEAERPGRGQVDRAGVRQARHPGEQRRDRGARRRTRPSATSADALRQVYETNVFGVVTVTNAMLPLLRRRRAARIVNMSSELGSRSWRPTRTARSGRANLAYNSSKTALNMVTVPTPRNSGTPRSR